MKSLFVLVALVFGVLVHAQSLTAKFDQRGIALLSYNNEAIVDLDNKVGDSFYIGTYTLDNTSAWGQIGATQSWDATTNTLTWTWPNGWGGVCMTQFSQNGNRVDVNITVINNSTQTLDNIDFYVFGVQFPEVPLEFGGPNMPVFHDNLDAVAVVQATYGSGTVVLADHDAKPLYLGYESTGPAGHYLLRTGTYADQSLSFLPTVDPVYRPIPAGGKDSWGFSLQFAPNGTDPLPMVTDVLQQYAQAFPQVLNWTDRRPIGQCFMTNPTNSPVPDSNNNPRGYTFAQNIDVHTTAGLAQFQAAALAYANQSLAVLQSVGSQGVIVWDLEGQQFPQPDISYVGSPDLLPQFSPEMDSIADEFFATFTKNGIRCGMTVRPQAVDYNGGNPTRTEEPGQQAALMIQKMGYAYKRWGCDIFYVDSNGGPANADSPDYFLQTIQALPNILIVPENIAGRYYAYTAPLASYLAPYKPLHTPGLPRAIWPGSFSMTYIGDAPNHDLTKNPNNPNQWDEFVAAVKQGDVLSFRAWFDDEPLNGQVKQIYQQAGVPTK